MNRPTVLCIEGDARFAAAYDILLGCAGYNVLLAENGSRASDLLQQTTVDAVVLTSRLANTTVGAMATTVRTHFPKAPLILVSDQLSILEDARNFVDAALPRNAFEHLLNEIEILLGHAQSTKAVAATAAA